MRLLRMCGMFCIFVAVNKQNWKVYDYDSNKKDNARHVYADRSEGRR
jgi:hypothetical protein